MDEQQRKAILQETFDTVSSGYDGKSLRFFPESAKHMAALLGLEGNEHVLDVACGTGHATLAVAHLLPRGSVTAVDFSSGMLDQARRKAASLDVRNVDFVERDMQALGFEKRFDVAVCAFGIFFVDDMDAQLSRIAAAVKPGGRVMIANFQEGYFQPMRDLFADRIERCGVQMPPRTWKRIAHEQGCRQLFEKAGLRDVCVEKKNVGYFLSNAGEWWDIVWNGGFRRMVSRLCPDDQKRFEQEHLKEVEMLRTRDGIWLDVGVLYTAGTRPK